MQIAYKTTKNFTPVQLRKLFSSVGWSSGDCPERLAKAMRGYSKVLSAWNRDELVGLVAAMDDGEMTAYLHYLLVAPDFQRQGIGRERLLRAQKRYAGYERILLLSEGTAEAFYRSLGFVTLHAASMVCCLPIKRQ